MCFQGVAFPPSLANLSATFLKNCGIGEGLVATTHLKTVVEAMISALLYILRLIVLSKCVLIVKCIFSKKSYCCHSNLTEITKNVTKLM